ncbi:MAG: hypothetical protein KAS32_05480 [Candidatus Peribacteraceae bacterium]|nr:hypothetical protein [Candidatus Peribacteraceae bacterium]
MFISKTCNFVLSDIFSYDFSKCNYKLLESIGWDLSSIDEQDKLKRNIQIGYLQKSNPMLARFLYDSTTRLIDFYLNLNNISNENIIVRARDGFYSTKKLRVVETTMPIEFKSIISKLIISVNRSRLLEIHVNGNVEIKGVRNKTVDNSYYNLFRNLNFTTKKGLYAGLESIRRSVLSSDNIMWFTRIDDGGAYYIPLIDEGTVKLNRSSLNLIEPTEIDRSFVWEEYIWPFAQSILVHASKT